MNTKLLEGCAARAAMMEEEKGRLHGAANRSDGKGENNTLLVLTPILSNAEMGGRQELIAH